VTERGAYSVVIRWSEKVGLFIAYVPELPGCGAEGPTQLAALERLQVAIDYWIAAAKTNGLGASIPKPRTFDPARPFPEWVDKIGDMFLTIDDLLKKGRDS